MNYQTSKIVIAVALIYNLLLRINALVVMHEATVYMFLGGGDFATTAYSA